MDQKKESLKKRIIEKTDMISQEIICLSHEIHDHPELGFQEYFACEQLTGMLRRHGFTVTTGSGGMETAFTAVKKAEKPGPKMAFLGEYDALEELGHGCGHNMIGAMAVGAGVALASVLEETGGEIYVFGTPGEETKGGKIIMLEKGVFDGMDFVLMCHPTSGPTMIQRNARACTTVFAEFTGKSAHSSVPATGINALTAARAAFMNIDLMHPMFYPQDTINGVIKEGGAANNVVPDYAKCEFCLRSTTLANLQRLVELTVHCINNAAALVGTGIKTEVDLLFSERYPNMPMGEAFKANLESLGESVVYADPQGMYGSSDVSNLSLYMPVIHEYISIAPVEINGHSPEFAEAAASARSDEACILGAKALAMTGCDILCDEDFRKEIRDAFEKQVPEIYRK